jgi:hypothetical protein
MEVMIQLHDDHIVVIELNEPGATPSTVKPGDKWRGWKYIRLRRKGNGRHTLVSRAQKALAAKEGMAIEIRGHA